MTNLPPTEPTHVPPPPPPPHQAAAIAPPIPDPVELEASEPATSPAKPAAKARPTAPKWETQTKDRLKAAIRQFIPHLSGMIDRDANEGDTRLLVTDFLCSALGYDRYADLTTEYQIKGQFADYGVRIDKELVAFIEVKRCTTTLAEKHLRQVQLYAANEGVEWMLLTNGRVWQAWHLTATLPMQVDLALDIDLLDEQPVGGKVGALFYLTRESFQRNQIDELWQQKRVTSPESLARTLVSDKMIGELRKELRRTSGYNADEKELAATLATDVIAPGLLR
jgi:hypothetical protein